MSTDWILYCDEAGNAGPNYWDREQPYHVSAGWLVSPDAHGAFENAIREACARTRAGELKGANLLRRPRGIRTIVRLFQELAATGCLPLFIIADRRFCVAGKAVETFLDPVTNPAAAWLPTGAVARRHGVWEVVAQLPDSALQVFAEAYREPSTDGFCAALHALVSALRAAQAPRRLIITFEEAEPHLPRITQYETHGSELASHGVETALNAPVFFHLVKAADRFIEIMHPAERMVVVHDEIRAFAAVLERTVRALTVAADVSPEFIGLDGEMVRLGVKQVAGFRVESSANVPGLQAADLLASSVARLARDVRNGRPWSAELLELASITLPLLLSEDDGVPPMLAGMLADRGHIAELLVPLVNAPPSM